MIAWLIMLAAAALCLLVLYYRDRVHAWVKDDSVRCRICHRAECLPVYLMERKRELFAEVLPGRDSSEAYCILCLNAILEAAKEAAEWARQKPSEGGDGVG